MTWLYCPSVTAQEQQEMTMRISNTDHLRLLASQETDDCVLWDRGTGGGYGRVRASTYCHRQVCAWTYGPAPGGMEAAHLCGEALCVNPRHIRWATHRENIADKAMHGTKRVGEQHSMAKVTAASVALIRVESGPLSIAAAKFGISRSQVHRIRTNQNWKVS